MLTLHRIRELPASFPEFVGEIARGLEDLYGPKAADAYRMNGPEAASRAIKNAAVDSLAVSEGGRVVGLLLAVCRGGVGKLSFVHVLGAYAGREVEGRLLREAVRTLRAGGVDGIVSDYLPMCPLDLCGVYEKLGFERIGRRLMVADLTGPMGGGSVNSRTIPCGAAHWRKVSEVIVDAYEGHMDRRLHPDVRDMEGALEFVKAAASGEYGAMGPGFIRGFVGSGRLEGVIVGCEAAPEVGFVLQVAVRRGSQGGGIGRHLLSELMRVFRKAGYVRMGLGVTTANPAGRLYERLGFTTVRQVDAYAWWRSSSVPGG